MNRNIKKNKSLLYFIIALASLEYLAYGYSVNDYLVMGTGFLGIVCVATRNRTLLFVYFFASLFFTVVAIIYGLYLCIEFDCQGGQYVFIGLVIQILGVFSTISLLRNQKRHLNKIHLPYNNPNTLNHFAYPQILPNTYELYMHNNNLNNNLHNYNNNNLNNNYINNYSNTQNLNQSGIYSLETHLSPIPRENTFYSQNY